MTLALQGYTELFEKGSSLQARRNEMQDQESGIRANLEAKESALEELKTKLLENEEAITKNQQQLYETKNTISIKEKNIEFSRHQIGDISERKKKDLAEIEQLRKKKSDWILKLKICRKV